MGFNNGFHAEEMFSMQLIKQLIDVWCCWCAFNVPHCATFTWPVLLTMTRFWPVNELLGPALSEHNFSLRILSKLSEQKVFKNSSPCHGNNTD